MPKKTFDSTIFLEGSQNLRESKKTARIKSATKPFKTNMSQTLSYTKDNLRNSDDFRVTVNRQKEYLLQTGQWSFLDMNKLKHLSRKASPRQ